MALTGEELRRRIKAAAELRGWGMRDLRDRLEEYGANRTLAEAMIRGDTPQRPRHIRDLSAVLRVPAHWFEDEDFNPEYDGQAQIDALHEKLDAMEARQKEMAKLIESNAAAVEQFLADRAQRLGAGAVEEETRKAERSSRRSASQKKTGTGR